MDILPALIVVNDGAAGTALFAAGNAIYEGSLMHYFGALINYSEERTILELSDAVTSKLFAREVPAGGGAVVLPAGGFAPKWKLASGIITPLKAYQILSKILGVTVLSDTGEVKYGLNVFPGIMMLLLWMSMQE